MNLLKFYPFNNFYKAYVNQPRVQKSTQQSSIASLQLFHGELPLLFLSLDLIKFWLCYKIKKPHPITEEVSLNL
jgi:hypothetical protein